MSKFADQVADLMAGGDRIVTQYMHDWDGDMTPEAIMRVAKMEIQDNSPEGRESKTDGSGRVRPSNLGESCARYHTLSWLSYPKIEGDDTLMKDGQQRHYWWQKAGLSAGFLTDIEVKVQIPYLELYGSMDGLMVDGSVFEFKTTGPTLYNKRLSTRTPDHAHLLQVHAYMKATGTKKASIVYEKRDYQVEWTEFRIDFDEAIYDALITRIAPVLTAVVRGEMPPMLEECLGLAGPRFKRCRFHEVCPSATFDVQTG